MIRSFGSRATAADIESAQEMAPNAIDAVWRTSDGRHILISECCEPAAGRINVLPPVGAELVVDGAVVGTLTSIGESLDLRRPVGLALIRREVEPGNDVAIRWDGGETEATVKDLPLIA